MKRLLIILASVLVLASCQKKEQPTKPVDVKGEWELVSISTKSVTIGDQTVSVYLKIVEESFEIYQVMGKSRPRRYTGTYTLKDKIFSGKYSDGKKLGSSYELTLTDSTMEMKSVETGETDHYKKSSIPANIINEAY